MEGNVKTSVTSTVASGLTTAQIRILAYEIGKQLSNNLQMQVLIANAISNAVATGTGAATDLALGGSGINGAGIALRYNNIINFIIPTTRKWMQPLKKF